LRASLSLTASRCQGGRGHQSK